MPQGLIKKISLLYAAAKTVYTTRMGYSCAITSFDSKGSSY